MAVCLQEKLQSVAVPPTEPKKWGFGGTLGWETAGPVEADPECPLDGQSLTWAVRALGCAEKHTWARTAGRRLPPWRCCVTSGGWLNLSEPQLSLWKTGIAPCRLPGVTVSSYCFPNKVGTSGRQWGAVLITHK